MARKEKPTTKLCKHCKTEIPYEASVCPQCRKKQKGGCLSKILIIFAVLIIFGLFGGNDNESVNIKFTEYESENENMMVTFEKSILFDDKGIKISITDFSEDSSSVDIVLTVENNSKKDYGIAAHSYSVNGLMAGGTEMMSDVDVPANKKGNIKLSFEKGWLTENGIDHIGKLDVLFWAYFEDFKEWDTGVVSVKTNLYDKEKLYKPSGEEIYSDDSMSLWLLEHEDNTYRFSVKNKTSYDVEYYVENCSVNDWSYENENYLFDVYSESIHGKTYFVYDFEIDRSFMDDNGIDSIDNFEFNLLMKDDYYEDLFDIWEAKSNKIVIK